MISCTKSELLIFNPVPVQSSMISSSWVDFHTLSTTIGDGPLEFNVSASQEEYLDLNDTGLYVRLRVDTTGNEADAITIGPANYLLHSLFQDVSLKLNDTVVQGGDQMYAYKSVLNSMLLFDADTKKTQLRACGYYKDEAGKYDDKTGTGFVERSKWISGKKELELYGPVHCDLMNQTRYIIPQVNVNLRLTRIKNGFAMLCYDTGTAFTAKIVILEALLYVRRVKLIPSILEAHEDGLKKHNALYPVQHMRMETFTVAKGSQSLSRENIFQGKMPKFVVVAMVENSAYNGAYNKNPYHFQHFDVNYVGLFREGESIPHRQPYDNISSDRYVRPYMGMIHALEQFNRNENNGISASDYIGGNTLFVYNLTPDLSCGSGCQQAYRNGNLRLEMKYSKPLPESINVLVYGVFDGNIEITKMRNIMMDY